MQEQLCVPSIKYTGRDLQATLATLRLYQQHTRAARLLVGKRGMTSVARMHKAAAAKALRQALALAGSPS